MWNVADGKPVATRTLPLGPFHGLSLAPDGKTVAIGAGARPRQGLAGQEGNPTYILKLPGEK